MELTFTDSIGYLASLFVLVSFLMKDIRLLRSYNLAGAALFVVYGCLLNYSLPIVITNSIILLIHVYHLLKPLYRKP